MEGSGWASWLAIGLIGWSDQIMWRNSFIQCKTMMSTAFALCLISGLAISLPTFTCALSPSSSSPLSLEGKRALVTGSSGGIGAGIALALAAQGASVLVHYNS